VLETATEKALDSDHFLHVSSDTILLLASLEKKNILEESLAAALLKWAKFQCEEHGEDPNDGALLRALLLPSLKLLKFGSMDEQNFAVLCKHELGQVLTVDERLGIFLALSNNSKDPLPKDFNQSSDNWELSRFSILRQPLQTLYIKLDKVSLQRVIVPKETKPEIVLRFQVIKRAILKEVGFPYPYSPCPFELQDVEGNVLVERGCLENSNYILSADTDYVLFIAFSEYSGRQNKETHAYLLPSNLSFTSGWLTMTIKAQALFFHRTMLSLTFKNAFDYPLQRSSHALTKLPVAAQECGEQSMSNNSKHAAAAKEQKDPLIIPV
jgi:hypothetical protein